MRPAPWKLGLAVPGIEIYLPISGTMTLGFYCKSHEHMIRDGVERFRKAVIHHADQVLLSSGELLEWMRVLRKGTPLASAADNVLNHNSLQVQRAERYISSSVPEFDLVEDMIRKEPRYRKGPRPHII